MSNKKPNVAASPAFILFLVFLVLKLCNVIDWSWWWVTSPLWLPLAVILPIMGLISYLKYRSEQVK